MGFPIRTLGAALACGLFAACEAQPEPDYEVPYEQLAHDMMYPDNRDDSVEGGARTESTTRVVHSHETWEQRRDRELAGATDRGVAEASARRGALAATRTATVTLRPVGDARADGTLTFEPAVDGVRIRGRITGLTPGRHALVVQPVDAMSRPDRATDERRRIGDVGSIVANADGVANVDIVDRTVRLDGPDSIVGRSIVLHAGTDTLEQPFGAGDRVATGVIGAASMPPRTMDRDRSNMDRSGVDTTVDPRR
jgi:superoxide dismutase, Cu-Zn family